MKRKNISVDALFQRFDKDKSYLISVDELAQIVKEYLGIQLFDEEKQVLFDYISQARLSSQGHDHIAAAKTQTKTFGRSELKREEVAKLLATAFDQSSDVKKAEGKRKYILEFLVSGGQEIGRYVQ